MCNLCYCDRKSDTIIIYIYIFAKYGLIKVRILDITCRVSDIILLKRTFFESVIDFAIYLRNKPVCHSNLCDPSATFTVGTLQISKLASETLNKVCKFMTAVCVFELFKRCANFFTVMCHRLIMYYEVNHMKVTEVITAEGCLAILSESPKSQ